MSLPEPWTLVFGAAAAGLCAQAIFFFFRLPSRVAILFELDGTPRLFVPKLVFFPLWLILISVLVTLFWSARTRIPLWHATGILVFLLGVCQLLVHANLGGDRLSKAVWLWIAIFIAFILASHSIRG